MCIRDRCLAERLTESLSEHVRAWAALVPTEPEAAAAGLEQTVGRYIWAPDPHPLGLTSTDPTPLLVLARMFEGEEAVRAELRAVFGDPEGMIWVTDVLLQAAPRALHRIAQLLRGAMPGEGEVEALQTALRGDGTLCLLYTSPSPRDRTRSRMPSSA
eukprot:TRINITY_DN8003_c0_g1_i1.p1 TRINITY_DN8003_c0_g1~~TRINITY_DN8003_c0_g1_i1.p1  ORF type:complete len:158 (+),score=28.56 TRINITY_DN8003_c0_g1_i1:88-561(+)